MVEMNVTSSIGRPSPGWAQGQPLSLHRHETLQRVDHVVQRLGTGKRLRILSLGNGFADPSQFLSGHDVVRQGYRISKPAQGVGSDQRLLPFQDDCFDLLVFQKGFQGVPASTREALVKEAARVSRAQILIVCPFSEPTVEQARRVVSAFYKLTFGTHHKALLEGTDRFLPDLKQLLMWSNREGLQAGILPHGQLFTWTLKACMNAYLEADGSGSLPLAFRRLLEIEFDWSLPALIPPSRIVLLSKEPLPDLHALDDECFGGEASRLLTSSLISLLQDESDEELQRLSKALEHGDRRRLERLLEDTIQRERFLLGFKDRVREFVGKDRREDDHGFGNHLMALAESLTKMRSPVIDLVERGFANHPEGVCFCLTYYLQRRPDQGEAWNDLGIFLMEKGEWEDAKKALVNACVLNYALAYRNLAFLYLTQGDVENARKVEQEAARKGLNPHLLRGLISPDRTASPETYEAMPPP
jgi:hypothetical protein